MRYRTLPRTDVIGLGGRLRRLDAGHRLVGRQGRPRGGRPAARRARARHHALRHGRLLRQRARRDAPGRGLRGPARRGRLLDQGRLRLVLAHRPARPARAAPRLVARLRAPLLRAQPRAPRHRPDRRLPAPQPAHGRDPLRRAVRARSRTSWPRARCAPTASRSGPRSAGATRAWRRCRDPPDHLADDDPQRPGAGPGPRPHRRRARGRHRALRARAPLLGDARGQVHDRDDLPAERPPQPPPALVADRGPAEDRDAAASSPTSGPTRSGQAALKWLLAEPLVMTTLPNIYSAGAARRVRRRARPARPGRGGPGPGRRAPRRELRRRPGGRDRLAAAFSRVRWAPHDLVGAVLALGQGRGQAVGQPLGGAGRAARSSTSPQGRRRARRRGGPAAPPAARRRAGSAGRRPPGAPAGRSPGRARAPRRAPAPGSSRHRARSRARAATTSRLAATSGGSPPRASRRPDRPRPGRGARRRRPATRAAPRAGSPRPPRARGGRRAPAARPASRQRKAGPLEGAQVAAAPVRRLHGPHAEGRAPGDRGGRVARGSEVLHQRPQGGLVGRSARHAAAMSGRASATVPSAIACRSSTSAGSAHRPRCRVPAERHRPDPQGVAPPDLGQRVEPGDRRPQDRRPATAGRRRSTPTRRTRAGSPRCARRRPRRRGRHARQAAAQLVEGLARRGRPCAPPWPRGRRAAGPPRPARPAAPGSRRTSRGCRRRRPRGAGSRARGAGGCRGPAGAPRASAGSRPRPRTGRRR